MNPGEVEPVQVAVRIRPLHSSELDVGCRHCVRKVDEEPQVIVGSNNNTSFTYSYVFDENDGQLALYTRCIRPILPKIFEGYNVTILAYGQTGSGKSYTMGTNDLGPESELGVIQQGLDGIFQRIEAVDEEYDVRVSFLELYNETLYDLLTGCTREASIVELRDTGQNIQIPRLVKKRVINKEEAMEALKEGSALRVTGATAMNATSSRSHAVFTITVTAAGGTVSKLHLVDLAGSERAKKTGTAGDRFKEGININRGLLALGNVISQLSEGAAFVNYRDSLLTRLLQDSLGGNSYTIMIACIGPADSNQDETLSTLRYADRALKIKNKPIINKDPQAMQIEQLKKENDALRLRIISGGNSCPPSHILLERQLQEEKKLRIAAENTLKQNRVQTTFAYHRNLLVRETVGNIKDRARDLLAAFKEQDKNETVSHLVNGLFEEIQQFDLEMDEHEMIGKMNDEEQIEIPEEIMTSQIESTRQIEDITKSLELKQQLYDQLTCYTSNFGEIHNSVEGLEALVQQLIAEKAELTAQLEVKNVKPNLVKSRDLEMAQNRLKQLEKELAQAQKRLKEQGHLIKMKEKSDEKIISLKNEIQHLKKLKVSLVHSMKAEFDRFRVFQKEKNKEVYKLRNLTNRQSNQIERIQKEYMLKQAVLRRKLEVAAAAKRKMEAALAKQKFQRSVPLNVAKVEEFIAAEVDVLESTVSAKHSLHRIMEDRAAVTKELSAVVEQLTVIGTGPSAVHLQARRDLLKQDIELQNAQIADLQQRILDSESDPKIHRWDRIHSLEEAKYALNCLFSILSQVKKDLIHDQDVLAELRSDYEDQVKEVQNLASKLAKVSSDSAKAQEQLVAEYEAKLFKLMLTADSPHRESVLQFNRESKENSPVLQPRNENKESVKEDPGGFIAAYMDFVTKNKSLLSVTDENTPQPLGVRRTGNFADFSLIKRPKVDFNFDRVMSAGKSSRTQESQNFDKTDDILNTTFIASD